jgi:hypothetical protein
LIYFHFSSFNLFAVSDERQSQRWNSESGLPTLSKKVTMSSACSNACRRATYTIIQTIPRFIVSTLSLLSNNELNIAQAYGEIMQALSGHECWREELESCIAAGGARCSVNRIYRKYLGPVIPARQSKAQNISEKYCLGNTWRRKRAKDRDAKAGLSTSWTANALYIRDASFALGLEIYQIIGDWIRSIAQITIDSPGKMVEV